MGNLVREGHDQDDGIVLACEDTSQGDGHKPKDFKPALSIAI